LRMRSIAATASRRIGPEIRRHGTAFKLRLPESYGGPGANLTTVCIAAEEFAKVSESIALISGQNGIAMIVPLMQFGNEEQRQRFFPEVAKGRMMTAVAITEPQSGSDVGSMKTRAARDGNGSYVLNGEKCFITFAPVADYILVFARIGDVSGGTRISAHSSWTPKRRALPSARTSASSA